MMRTAAPPRGPYPQSGAGGQYNTASWGLSRWSSGSGMLQNDAEAKGSHSKQVKIPASRFGPSQFSDLEPRNRDKVRLKEQLQHHSTQTRERPQLFPQRDLRLLVSDPI